MSPGADILAGEVERMALPALSRLGGPAVLASGNGRVIASTTIALLPGVVLRPGPGMCRMSLAGSLPWMLLRTGPARMNAPPPGSRAGDEPGGTAAPRP